MFPMDIDWLFYFILTAVQLRQQSFYDLTSRYDSYCRGYEYNYFSSEGAFFRHRRSFIA